MTKPRYMCPFPECRTLLNPGTEIIFRAENEREQQGIILLSPKVGNYSVISDQGFLRDGELVELSCPTCHRNLMHIKDPNFAYVLRQDNNSFSAIIFSRRKGEHATFKIGNKGDISSFGPDSDALDVPELSGTIELVRSVHGMRNVIG